MSSKNKISSSDISTKNVDYLQKHNRHRMDAQGRELVNSISLVAVADSRPVTLGERIRRYTSSPQFQHDLMNGHDEDYTDEDFDLVPLDQNAPLSKHEERSQEIRSRVRERKNKEAELKKQEALEAEKAEKEAFRKRFQELRSEAEGLPPSPPAGGAK